MSDTQTDRDREAEVLDKINKAISQHGEQLRLAGKVISQLAAGGRVPSTPRFKTLIVSGVCHFELTQANLRILMAGAARGLDMTIEELETKIRRHGDLVEGDTLEAARRRVERDTLESVLATVTGLRESLHHHWAE